MVYDRVFEEMYDPSEYESLTDEEAEEYARMNRKQQRAAEKKRKLPFCGVARHCEIFGDLSPWIERRK